MACHIERLACEVVVVILKEVPDLGSLYNLIIASPNAYRVFNGFAFEILESVMSFPAMTDQLRRTIEVLAHIRSGFRHLARPTVRTLMPGGVAVSSDLPEGIAFPSPADVVQMVKRPGRSRTWNHIGKETVSSFLITFDTSISSKTSPPIIRSILADAARIQRLAHLCVAHYLEQLRDVEFQHPADPSFTYLPPPGVPETDLPPPWERTPNKTETYQPRLDRPPMWTEEYRMARVGWNLQLMSDLKKATNTDMFDHLGWDREDKVTMRAAGMSWFFSYSVPSDTHNQNLAPEYPYHEARTLLDWLNCPMPEGGVDPPRLEECLRHKEKQATDFAKTLPTPEAPKSGDPGLLLQRMSVGLEVFLFLSRKRFSPLQFVSFDPFRRLGFAIWDVPRLGDLELHPVCGLGRPGCWEDFFFEWRCLLTSEELVEAKRRREELKGMDRPIGWSADTTSQSSYLFRDYSHA